MKAEKQNSQSESKIEQFAEVSDSRLKSIFSATNKSMIDVVEGEDAIIN